MTENDGLNRVVLPTDVAQASRFLRTLAPTATDFAFRSFSDNPAIAGIGPRKYSGKFEVLSAELSAANNAGSGIFVVINEGGQSANEITRVRAVFVDLDGARLEPVMDCALQPHMIVTTSPDRWHAYWLCSGLETNRFTELQKAIASRFRGDTSVCDLPRVMRLPGYWHQKRSPFQVALAVRDGAHFSADDLFEEFHVRRASTEATHHISVPVGERVGVIVAEDRHNDLLKLSGKFARLVLNDGLSREAALNAMLSEAGRGRWTREVPASEIRGALDGALKKFGHESHKAVTRNLPKIETASDLYWRAFPEVEWAINGIIPEGVMILSGDPKMGKSWLVYQASLSIATGMPLWPERVAEVGGDVLLLALEDNHRRMHRRLKRLAPHFIVATSRPEGGVFFNFEDLSNLHYTTEWPRAEEGVQLIADWLRGHPKARMVVIDTVSAFRNPEPGRKSAYATDYAVGEMLKPLAQEFKCAIVLVMHNRKLSSSDPFQLVSGTQGMTGSVDNVAVLRRERGSMDAALYIDGRDIEETQELAMEFENGFWKSGSTVESAQLSVERSRVVAAVAKLGCNAISGALVKELEPQDPRAVRKMLSLMVKQGQLALKNHVYSFTHTVTPVIG